MSMGRLFVIQYHSSCQLRTHPESKARKSTLFSFPSPFIETEWELKATDKGNWIKWGEGRAERIVKVEEEEGAVMCEEFAEIRALMRLEIVISVVFLHHLSYFSIGFIFMYIIFSFICWYCHEVTGWFKIAANFLNENQCSKILNIHSLLIISAI